MTNYATLIDAETWAFIERTNSFYPPDTIDFSMDRQRAVYDRMCRAFHAGYPDDVTAETSTIALPDRTIPIRIYRRAEPDTGAVVLYFHGGGYVLGGLESHDDVCADLTSSTGYELVSVDYRLAPEHLHPAAFEDALAAFRWLAARTGSPIVLAGDSAGGNLAAAVAHATRREARRPAGQLLIYPGLGTDRSGRSYADHAEAPMLTVRDLDFYRDIRGGPPAPDPTREPLADTDFSGLPPTVVVTAECDPLSSDGELYRDRIVAAGGRAIWREESGLVHSFMRGRKTVVRAAEAFARIAADLGALGRGVWPG